MNRNQLLPLSAQQTDLLLAFEMVPVGLLVSRFRRIQSFNQTFSAMFGYASGQLEGESLACFYPSTQEFEHIGDLAHTVMCDKATYADERIMKRADGRLFWCRVAGRAIDRSDPFSTAVWVFEDISGERQVAGNLTAREREIARYLVLGKSSKEIGKSLKISHRTVEAHRARLMRKLGAKSSAALVVRLMGS